MSDGEFGDRLGPDGVKRDFYMLGSIMTDSTFCFEIVPEKFSFPALALMARVGKGPMAEIFLNSTQLQELIVRLQKFLVALDGGSSS